MNVRSLNKIFQNVLTIYFFRKIFLFVISRKILENRVIKFECYVKLPSNEKAAIVTTYVVHCYEWPSPIVDSRAYLNIHIALGATVALFSLTVFQTLTRSISLYKHKKESLISLTLPNRSISFQKF
jgi:hypothetical protein